MQNITVTFTKEEADAAFSQLVGCADNFDALIVEEGKKPRPSADRIAQLAMNKQKIVAAKDKLFNAGASFWC